MAPDQFRWTFSFTVTLDGDAPTDPLASQLQADLATEIQTVLRRELERALKFRDDGIGSVTVRPNGKMMHEDA